MAAAAMLATPLAAEAAAPKPDPDLLTAYNYVLASCLVQQYRNQPLGAEADLWASGLVEDGNLPAAAYGALAKLAETRRPQVKSSQSGQPMRLESCISLYNDPSLRAAVARIVRAKR